MAKTKYSEARSEVGETVNKLFNNFPDLFMHIHRSDILLVEKDSPKSQWNAKIRLLNGFYRTLTQKKIVIEVWKQGWELSKSSERALNLYREMYKVDLNKNKTDYKLNKYDLTDFKKIVEKVGLHNETIDQYFSKVVAA